MAPLAGYHNIHSRPQADWTECPERLDQAETERLWALIKSSGPDDCWLWRGSVTGTGSVKHGQFTVRREGKQRGLKPHRVAWVLAHGAIPDGLKVCHRCDEPRCCNPSHLFLGTQQENLTDARQKGRLREWNFRKPFSLEAYRAIVLTTERGVDIARRFGVTEISVSRIRNGHQGRRVVDRILQDELRKTETRLGYFEVPHQLEQPLSLGKVR